MCHLMLLLLVLDTSAHVASYGHVTPLIGAQRRYFKQLLNKER
jgi:hypothetical protein